MARFLQLSCLQLNYQDSSHVNVVISHGYLQTFKVSLRAVVSAENTADFLNRGLRGVANFSCNMEFSPFCQPNHAKRDKVSLAVGK